MHPQEESQPGSGGSGMESASGAGRVGDELVVPNPKLKLMDQVREVLRIKHYSIRTERCYCDWIRRYIHYHRMRSREELFPAPLSSCGALEFLCRRDKFFRDSRLQFR